MNVSFHDKIASLHEDYLHLKANAHVPGHKDRQIEVKDQRQCDFAVAKGSMMQLWSIASRDGPVYDLLIQIISGNIVGCGQQLAHRQEETRHQGGQVGGALHEHRRDRRRHSVLVAGGNHQWPCDAAEAAP